MNVEQELELLTEKIMSNSLKKIGDQLFRTSEYWKGREMFVIANPPRHGKSHFFQNASLSARVPVSDKIPEVTYKNHTIYGSHAMWFIDDMKIWHENRVKRIMESDELKRDKLLKLFRAGYEIDDIEVYKVCNEGNLLAGQVRIPI